MEINMSEEDKYLIFLIIYFPLCIILLKYLMDKFGKNNPS